MLDRVFKQQSRSAVGAGAGHAAQPASPSALFTSLSKVPWQWAAYLAIYSSAFHWLDKFAPYKEEVLFALLAASPVLWLIEIMTLRPSIRRLLFSFGGRAPRSLYWMGWTTAIAAASVGGVAWAYIKFHAEVFLSEWLMAAIFLAMPLIPLWAVVAASLEVRRWHDLNHSGWFYLLNFIPFAQIVTYPYLLFFRGTLGRNAFGENPLSRTDSDSPEPGWMGLVNVALLIFFVAFTVIAFKYIL